MNQLTDWQARAEKAEAELERIRTQNWNDRLEEIAMALGCDMPKQNPYVKGTIEAGIFELRAELERLKSACAEMREALTMVREFDDNPGPPSWQDTMEKVRHALSSDAGRDYISKDEVKLLVDALNDLVSESDYAAHDAGCKFVKVWWKAKTVLNGARAKGVIP